MQEDTAQLDIDCTRFFLLKEDHDVSRLREETRSERRTTAQRQQQKRPPDLGIVYRTSYTAAVVGTDKELAGT